MTVSLEEAQKELTESAAEMLWGLAKLSRQADLARGLAADIKELFDDIISDMGAHLDDDISKKMRGVVYFGEEVDLNGKNTSCIIFNATRAATNFMEAASNLYSAQARQEDDPDLGDLEEQRDYRVDLGDSAKILASKVRELTV